MSPPSPPHTLEATPSSALCGEALSAPTTSTPGSSVVGTGTDNPIGSSWPVHFQPLPLALLSQSKGRMDASLVNSLHRTSSIQGLLGQHLSSSQLSFSSSLALPPAERFFSGSLQDNPSHRASQRGLGLALGQGSRLPYVGLYSKWSLSGKKGFNTSSSGRGWRAISERLHSGEETSSQSSAIWTFFMSYSVRNRKK
ncbi:hypothetical protein AOLI_G00207940 [Acnodon oligacanthus]